MLHHHQVVTGRKQLARKQLCPVGPTYNLHRKYGSAGDIEFDFWGAQQTSCSKHTRDEFQFQAQIEGLGGSSPPLWKENTTRLSVYESSPLLPHDHQYSNFSPRTRSKAIAEGRRELMEMINGMPEGHYELSLKDIVDEEQQALQEVTENIVTDERSFSFGSEVETMKPKKKKSIKSGEISRSGSMDNETFLIKMFFPRSLGSRRKATSKRRSKVSPRASFEISENHNDRQQWIVRSFVAGESKSNGKLCSSSFKNTNSSRNRQDDGNFSTGCWPFFRTKKSKSWRLRGCIF